MPVYSHILPWMKWSYLIWWPYIHIHFHIQSLYWTSERPSDRASKTKKNKIFINQQSALVSMKWLSNRREIAFFTNHFGIFLIFSFLFFLSLSIRKLNGGTPPNMHCERGKKKNEKRCNELFKYAIRTEMITKFLVINQGMKQSTTMNSSMKNDLFSCTLLLFIVSEPSHFPEKSEWRKKKIVMK